MRTRALTTAVATVSAGVLIGRATCSATIRALRARLADVEYQLMHDPLTTLLNRAGLISHYTATTGHMRWLVLIDVNDFKAVNDGHGHHTGDALLHAFSAHLRAVAGEHGGVAGRIGGDEFVLLLPYLAHQPDGTGFVAALQKPIPVPGAPDSPAVTASAGVCLAGPVSSWSTVLRSADIALYHAKADRRRVTFSAPGMTHPAPGRVALRPDPRLRDLRHHITTTGGPR
jgi:diguanylate cyclase (GGDEF)-like protein